MALLPFAAEEKAIKARFAALWASAAPDIPVKYEGVPFTQPESGSWVALVILQGGGERQDLGATSARHRYAGAIVVQCFASEAVAAGASSAKDEAADVADLVTGIFHEAEFTTDTGGRITCRTTTIRPVGPTAGWWQVNAETTYVRDEFLTPAT